MKVFTHLGVVCVRAPPHMWHPHYHIQRIMPCKEFVNSMGEHDAFEPLQVRTSFFLSGNILRNFTANMCQWEVDTVSTATACKSLHIKSNKAFSR